VAGLFVRVALAQVAAHRNSSWPCSASYDVLTLTLCCQYAAGARTPGGSAPTVRNLRHEPRLSQQAAELGDRGCLRGRCERGHRIGRPRRGGDSHRSSPSNQHRLVVLAGWRRWRDSRTEEVLALLDTSGFGELRYFLVHAIEAAPGRSRSPPWRSWIGTISTRCGSGRRTPSRLLEDHQAGGFEQLGREA